MPTVLSVLRLALAALALVAMGQQLLLHIGASYDPLNFFSYFTNLANLFAVFALLLSALHSSSSSRVAVDVVRYLSAVNMAIVGVVFSVLLRNVDLGALLPWVNFVLHYVMPIAIVADWLVQPPAAPLDKTYVTRALVVPAAYLLYVLLRGAIVGWYPYPFLNPLNVGGYGGVAMYSGGIAVVFVLAGWGLLAAGNSRARRVSERS